QCEKERGFEIVETGSVPWLPAADWPNDIVITQKGKEIRIVAIYAKRPGNGAFRRLITAIIQAGMVPVIVTPVHEMRDTMKRWGWKQKLTGTNFHDREETWHPSEDFIRKHSLKETC